MSPAHRATVLNTLATAISSVTLARPIRLAIDGRTASGKTTLADALGAVLTAQGRDVIRTSIDGFHRPKIERYARGRQSPEGYYHDGRDLDAINALLLRPLGPDGSRAYRTASFDLETDTPIDQPPRLAAADAILIVDGTFLQRPELAENFDLSLFVETTEAISEQRGVGRDSQLLGGTEAARQLYATRYQPAYRLYESLCYPERTADAVFNNEDFERPALRLKVGGRLG